MKSKHIVDCVFKNSKETPFQQYALVYGWIFAMILHVAAWLFAYQFAKQAEAIERAALMHADTHARVYPQKVISLENFQVEASSPKQRPKQVQKRSAEKDHPKISTHARAPKQATEVITRENPPAEPPTPLNKTADTIVVGTAPQSSGGETASLGTNDAVGNAAGNTDNVATGGTGDGSRAQGIALTDDEWSCPWPKEADTAQINEQVAVVRVIVTERGVVESVEVMSDPGSGFGSAAAACAKRAHFSPAYDHDGNPIRARSAPIRVRFTR